MSVLDLAGIAVLAVVLVLGLVAPRAFAAAPPPKPATVEAPAEAKAPPLSMKELQERLARLAQTPPPTEFAPAAMCYEMAAPPKTVDYVCPLDGSRTQYARDSGMVDYVESIPSMREAVKRLPGLDASLDERAMCRRCTPKGDGRVALVLKYPDGKLVRTESVTGADLQLLSEFLSGSLKHSGSYGQESPLKNQLPRLRELLGLSAK